MKFTFTAQGIEINGDVDYHDTTTVEFKAEPLSEVLQRFEMFLRACGYSFDGYLGINDEMGQEIPESGYNSF